MHGDDAEPLFTAAQMERLLHKRVLAGITVVDAAGAVRERTQVVGTVASVEPMRQVVLRLSDGSDYLLPPDLRPFEEAPPGEYRLRSTGEVVIDPDFLCNWTMTDPTDHQ